MIFFVNILIQIWHYYHYYYYYAHTCKNLEYSSPIACLNVCLISSSSLTITHNRYGLHTGGTSFSGLSLVMHTVPFSTHSCTTFTSAVSSDFLGVASLDTTTMPCRLPWAQNLSFTEESREASVVLFLFLNSTVKMDSATPVLLAVHIDNWYISESDIATALFVILCWDDLFWDLLMFTFCAGSKSAPEVCVRRWVRPHTM